MYNRKKISGAMEKKKKRKLAIQGEKGEGKERARVRAND